MPVCGLFEGVRESQYGFFSERLAQELQADWQLWRARKTAGHTDAANASQVCRDSKDIDEIHLQRVIDFLPDLERGGRRSRRYDGVHLFEGFQKIVADES